MAAQGHASSQHNLGVSYAFGEGVVQDYQQAYAWWAVAAANGHGEAVEARDRVAKVLSPAALAEGQELAKRYFASAQTKN
ncbi:MAG: hypothetical protein ACRCYV_10570 [Aeromonas sp.]